MEGSINNFDFLHGDNHQGKVASKTTSFRWVFNSGLFNQHYHWNKKSNFEFLHGDNHQGKVASKTFTLVGCGQVCFLYNQIARFSDQQYLWIIDNSCLSFLCIALVIKGR